jgi:hypothetical protein
VAGPDYCVVLFNSTSGAIRAEKLAKEAGITVKLIPVPRHLSSDCGVCLRCEAVDVLTLRSLLEKAEVEFEDIARV